MLFAIKLASVPALVTLISLVARRLGPRAAGLLIGLPLATGPVVFFLTLSHGSGFGVSLVDGVLRGLVATEAFAVAYALSAGRLGWGWGLSLTAGLCGFAIIGLGMSELRPSGIALIALCVAGVVLALATVRRLAADMKDVLRPQGMASTGRSEILLRAALATAMFAAITILSETVGPAIGGLLAPFPVVTAVMAVFTQRTHGGADTLSLLAGMVRGTVSFWAFFATLAIALRGLGVAPTMLIACAAAIAVGAGLSPFLRTDRGTAPLSLPVPVPIPTDDHLRTQD